MKQKPAPHTFFILLCPLFRVAPPAYLHLIAPILEEVAAEHDGKIKVAKMDVDAHPRVASQYRIMSIPTLLFFKDGELVDQVIGAIPKAQLINYVSKLLG